MRSTIRSVLTLAFAGALVAACTGAAAPQAPASAPAMEAVASTAPAPVTTPVPTPKEITPAPAPATPPPTPTPTPWPSTDAQGAEVVRGIETLTGLTTNYTTTRDGDVGHYRGGVVALEDAMNDPRVSGTVTFAFGIDVYDKAGVEWGTVTVKNDNGAWNGTCTGGAWNDGDGIAWSCWLTGRGAYDGYTYYRQVRKEATDPVASVTGVVYPGKQPTP